MNQERLAHDAAKGSPTVSFFFFFSVEALLLRISLTAKHLDMQRSQILDVDTQPTHPWKNCSQRAAGESSQAYYTMSSARPVAVGLPSESQCERT